MSEVLVKVDGVSKKFCKDLKRSLWYGMLDIGRSLLGYKPFDGLRKDEFWAVSDVSFELKRGKCLGLIGHNGAGKSTLLKMLNGLIKPDNGRIEMRGKVGALIELGAGFNPVLTGRENIYNNGAVLGFSKKDIDLKFDEIVAFSDIGDFVETPVQNYSSGMKVRLGFAIAAQMKPDILILDEVLAVGDASFRLKCFNKISELLENTAVIFVSHSMAQVARICDDVLLLKNGCILNYDNKTSSAIADYLANISNTIDARIFRSDLVYIELGKIADEYLQPKLSFSSGQPFNIIIHVNVKNFVHLTMNRLMLVFVDNELNSALQIDEDVSFTSNGRYEIILSFKNILFKTGKFYVNAVVLNGKRGDFVAAVDNLTSFSVYNDKDGYAPIFAKPIIGINKLSE